MITSSTNLDNAHDLNHRKETSVSLWNSPLECSLLTVCSRLRVRSRNSCMKMFTPLWRQSFLLHWFFEERFLMRPCFPIPHCLRQEYLRSKFLPWSTPYPRDRPKETFFPKWWSRDWSRAEIGGPSTTVTKRNHWAIKNGSPIIEKDTTTRLDVHHTCAINSVVCLSFVNLIPIMSTNFIIAF